MSTPNLSVELQTYWQVFNGQQPITDDATRDRFTQGFAALAADIDPRWGRKARAAGAPVSTDTIAYWRNGPAPTGDLFGLVDARDLIDGTTGAAHWLGEGDPRYDGISAQWIHVAPAAPVPEPPPGEPPPDDAIGQLFRDVESIRQNLETIAATVNALAVMAKDVQARGVLLRWR